MPNGGHGTPSTTSTTPITSSVTLSADQFHALLEAIKRPVLPPQQVPSDQVQSRQASAQQVGSFTHCMHRFAGRPIDDVEAFVTCITVYKECANVSDDNALKGFAMLLTDLAATWWNGVKTSITTFDDAIKKLKIAFGHRKPAYKIYREIFSCVQEDTESTDIFICKVRALFAQIKDELSEKVQIDMIFGLLSLRIRRQIARDSVESFDQLLEKAREIEANFQEEDKRDDGKQTHKNNSKDSSNILEIFSKQSERTRCTFCRKFGHSHGQCRQKMKRSSAASDDSSQTSADKTITKNDPVSKPTISCYGCGAPNVIKSNCAKCKSKTETSAQALDIFSLNSDFQECKLNPRSRPLLLVNIKGFDGFGFIDSAAKISIAGIRLYEKLKSKNQEFQRQKMTVTFADGVGQTKEVLYATVDVKIKDRLIPTTFVIFPEAKQNKTLLGIDFLNDAKIVIDAHRKIWYFSDEKDNTFDLVFENFNDKLMPAEPEIFSVETLRSNEGVGLTENQRKCLNELIGRFREIFGPSTEATPFAEHKIETDKAAPIAVPPYQMTKYKKEILEKKINEMLKQDIIEPCESPWASPVVLVPKRDNSWRVCVDYRKLNSVTRSDKYPLPRMDELLHLAKQTLFMTTIDLKSGYWQIAVRECDRDKTCFTSPFGTFRFKRMPFGLKNSGATFQRLIDRFKNGLSDVTILAYLDDLIVVSPSFEKHLNDLEKVFERLKTFKLRANRDKCFFCKTSVEYLGHVITEDGISPNPQKISAIADMLPPKNLSKLKSFIQTCSWFRRFVPNFADVARPLTSLLKKDAKWTWDTPQQEAFEELKRALTTAPVLRQADESLPFKIKTDASNYALGAVLMQGEGETEKPIEYASRLLKSSEKNYDTTQKEALAVVWACQKFRGYIEGNKVIVSSDHQPLRWLMSLKSPSGRLARWALSLQPLDLQIQYIPGKSNVIADSLSRPPLPNDIFESCAVCPVAVEYPHLDPRETREKQRRDAEICKIIDSFERKSDVDLANWLDRGYIMENGILFRYNPEMDVERAQLVLPREERLAVLKENHDDANAGHYGIEKTIQRISSKYFWPGMRQDIAKYVGKCLECQRYKATHLKPAGLLRTPPSSQRFEVIAVDLFGPLPLTPSGNKWILVVEDVASKWVELFALQEATVVNCARTLIDEVFLRYGFPRKMISDNGVQFVGHVMQYVAECFGVKQNLIPVYHPEANPVERKNQDLKSQLAILVGENHEFWDDKLPSIRFAMNSVKSKSTGFTPAYLTFAREIRSESETRRDYRAVIQNENFVQEITPYLLRVADVLEKSKENQEKAQDKAKSQADQNRRSSPVYKEGDLVLVKTYFLSKGIDKKTSKFYPKKDGPYVISRKISPVSYEVARPTNPEVPLGKYHVSDIFPFKGAEVNEELPQPVRVIKKRGRPPKKSTSGPGSASTSFAESRGGGCHIPGKAVRTRQVRERRGVVPRRDDRKALD